MISDNDTIYKHINKISRWSVGSWVYFLRRLPLVRKVMGFGMNDELPVLKIRLESKKGKRQRTSMEQNYGSDFELYVRYIPR